MLMTLTATGADGKRTRFEQRMEMPAHGFLDVAAALDRTGMKDCLGAHLRADRLRSALSQARGFALPWLMMGMSDEDAARRETTIDVDGTTISVSIEGRQEQA